jgi:hypothetical protein
VSARRLPRIVVQALVIGLAIGFLYWAVVDWSLPDAGAYWEAAHRVRNGEPLYPPVGDVESSEVYRYAPWFAWVTVPFTFLPLPLAGVLWSAILVGASVAAVFPLLRSGALLHAVFFGSVLIAISAKGNVHALMIAWLIWGLERRSGPLWVALAASLKAVPILFALVYLGRRQWWRFAASIVITAVLVAPFLLHDLSNYVTSSGFAGLLITWPPVYVAVGVAGVAATLWLARGRFGWLAASTTVALALPRFFVYDITFLLPGALPAAPAPGTSNELPMDPSSPHSARTAGP